MIIDGTLALQLRPLVAQFAQSVEQLLRTFDLADAPEGWVGTDPADIITLIDTDVAALDTAVAAFDPETSTAADILAIQELCISISANCVRLHDAVASYAVSVGQ